MVSVHLGFSDRIRAKVSKRRFISLPGKWRRIPFDGRLFPTQLEGAMVLQTPPFIVAILKVTIMAKIRHVQPTFLYKSISVKRERKMMFFQILQVVSVTQYVCLIAQMFPTQY